MSHEIKNNSDKKSFEITIENETAVLTYHYFKGDLVLIHTEVPERLRGNGLSACLAQGALDFAIEQNLKIILHCPTVSNYIEKHPEYNHLVKADHSKNYS